MATLAKNQRAIYDYEIKETFEAGLVLSGPEVKSAKGGNISLKGSYAVVTPRGATLLNAHIGPYKYAKQEKYDPTRTRQLLLQKSEIKQLVGKEKGLVIVPLEIFSGRRGLVKVKLGLGRARKKLDKREYIKKRDVEKDIRRRVNR